MQREDRTIADCVSDNAPVQEAGTGSDRTSLIADLLTAQPITFALSAGQRRLWMFDQLAPGSLAYIVCAGLSLTGPLDTDALAAAISDIAARHEILRTRFVEVNGEPRQVVLPPAPVDLAVDEVSGGQGAVAEWVRRAAASPFDLAGPPAWRCLLLRRSEGEAVLVVAMHHILTDNWSMRIFFEELATFYEARLSGSPAHLPELAIQYGDFAEWQAEQGGDPASEAALHRRSETLAGAPELSTLPTDRPRPPQQSDAYAEHMLPLADDLFASLSAFAAREGATPFMLVLTALQVMLHRMTRQEEILIGIPLAGRHLPEVEPLIGLFVGTAVISAHVEEEQRLVDLLGATRRAVVDALEHPDLPFERLVELVNPPRSLQHTPLFQVMFAQIKAAAGRRAFGRAFATPYVISTPGSRFDLVVNLIEDEIGKWWLQFEYNPDLYDGVRIHSFARGMFDLLAEMIRDPAAPVVRPADTAALRRTSPLRLRRRRRTARFAPHYVPPRDDVERRIVAIWQSVLGIDEISLTDEFFDLGGTSFAAIRIISQVRKAFAVALPVSTLFAEPTVAYMAKLVRGEAEKQTSLVALCRTGKRPPLFAAGSNHRYLELSRALGPDQPFYKLDVYRLNEMRLAAGEAPFASVEATAAAFIEDMLAVQPAGPYFIAGQCEGGIVAMEIARQLRGRGHEIGLVLQFDTPVNGYFRKLSWARRLLVSLARGEFGHKTAGFIRRRGAGRLPPELEEQQHLRLREEIWSAIYAYRQTEPLPGEVTLLRASETYGIYEDVATGWDKVAERVVVEDVPGDHLRFFSHSDSQKIVGQILARAQDEARRRAAGSTAATA